MGAGTLPAPPPPRSLKECFNMERLKPELNKQVDHVSLASYISIFTVMSVVKSMQGFEKDFDR